MIEHFATIDFETFYSTEYSLSKMQTDEYILDPRFEIILVSVKASNGAEPRWCSGTHKEIKEFLEAEIDWPKTAVCAHHTNFDGFIATRALGLKPLLWLDTLPMLRMRYPWWKRYSLQYALEQLNLGRKGTQVQTYLGYRRADLSPAQLQDYAGYCMNDVATTHAMARLLLEDTPFFEVALIDMAVRMFTQPRILGDTARLQRYYESEVGRKQELLAKCNTTLAELMSNAKLAEVLSSLGVEPPTKTSKTTGKQAYAFAKTDKEFKKLVEHPDSDVQAVVAARLGVKSTIAETRAKRLVDMSKRLHGLMPVYLNHAGAKTTLRYSGGDAMNWQNIPARGSAAEIRNCLVAPPGYKLVVGDSSNIELRFAMAAAGQRDVLERISQYDELGEGDVYCDFASILFGKQVTAADKFERNVGKMGMLLAQYGGGAERFREAVREMIGLVISPELAEITIHTYRSVYTKVKKLWYYCDNEVLPAIHNRQLLTPVDVNGWLLTCYDGFHVPGLVGVTYHNLRKNNAGEWVYDTSSGPTKLYGGKVVENVCQHGARQIVLWQTLRIKRRFPVSLSVHDEVVCVVKANEAEECAEYMRECLALAPKWCRGEIPLSGKVHIGTSYGEAK